MTMAVLVVGALLATVAGVAATAGPAAAQVATPESFAGSASATALKLSLLGINLTVGQSDAEADSSQKALADASVIAPGSLVTLGVTSASVPAGANTTETTPQGCNISVPLPTLITISAACAQSAVSVSPSPPPTVCAPSATATAPTACGSAEVLQIDVGVTQLLDPILTAVQNATAGLSTTVGNILSNLPVVTPLLNNLLNGPLLGGLGITTADPISTLISALERATELLEIQVLPSVSSVATTPGAVTAASEADGIVVTLLPGVLLYAHGTEPVLQLKVASGSSTSTYNRSTCQSSSSFVAGLLAGELLGTPLDVGTGTLSLGSLGSVTLGGGSVAPPASNGAVSSTADGLDINLLNGLVALDVGHATSSVVGACAVAAVVTTTTSTTVIPPTTGTIPIVLATTGTSAPLLPIGLALILMGYITWRARRRRQMQRSVR